MGAPVPRVGEWYQSPDGDTFEVVASDAEGQTVEVQFFDGTIEEYDFETWSELGLRPAQPQEDWSGSMDLPHEDYGVDPDQPTRHSRNPLDDIDQ